MRAAEGRLFTPDTIKVMQVALNVAWDSLSPEEQDETSKSLLASRILDAAAGGETRLVIAAGQSTIASFGLKE